MQRRRRLSRPVAGEVVIRRPVHEVYDFYRDFSNMPRFLGDVVAVRRTADDRYRWIVAGPFGTRIPLTVVILDEQVDRLLRFRSSGPPLLRGRWELAFAVADGGGTRVRERLAMPLGAVGRAALALLAKSPQQEVEANLRSLKQVLEAGEPDRTAPSVDQTPAPP